MKNRTHPFPNFILLFSLLLFFSCEGFFGKKIDPSFIDVPVYDDRQVAYVPIQPVWEGFTYPVDIIAGYDQLIYVADGVTEEIISFDESGQELGRFRVPGLKAIAQDRSLDILAIGTFDTTLNATNYTLNAIYRIELNKNGAYGLNNAYIEKKIVHPLYFKTSITAGDQDVSLGAIGVRANNSYYVTRSGPVLTSLFGPDDAVLIFDETDDFISSITVKTNGGFFNNYFKTPVGLSTLAQPPQSPAVNTSGDFIFTSQSGNTAIKVQYISVNETENGVDYTVKELLVGDTAKAERFLYEPNRFGNPVDVAYTGDGTNYMFVVDSEKDSLYQFTNGGLEGVRPPAGSGSNKNIRVSFGGTGQGLTQFNSPTAVTYVNQILYVADGGNGRVLRFKLTTDFD